MDYKKTLVFEKYPVWKAVATMALPAILGQLVTMIYNLADTLYIGQTGDEFQVAAVSLSYAAFMMLMAIGNLFGVGGASLISRKLGEKRSEDAKHVAAFSFYGSLIVTLAYSILLWIFMDPILRLLGSSDSTIGFGRDYLFWTTVVGGVPTVLGVVLGNLLRSEGGAKYSSIGIAIGGILNIILDPIFIFALELDVEGAAIATMISNAVALIYYIGVILYLKKRTILSLNPKNIQTGNGISSQVFSVGLPAAAATMLAILANAALFKVLSGFGDSPVAAMGIVKKIDSIILSIAMGLSQGALPLIAYNYAAKNYDRMKGISVFVRKAGVLFSLFCIVIFEIFASELVHIFIVDSPEVVRIGADFLRIACLGTLAMVLFFLLNTTFQAMGKGRQSLLLVVLRQAVINLPILFTLTALFGMAGAVWTQLIADTIAVGIATLLFRRTLKQLNQERLEMN